MEIFRRKKRIHLSPRLARTIGQNTKPMWYYLSELGVIAAVLGAVLFMVAQNSNEQLPSTIQANENSAVGSVLGAQAPSVVNYQIQPGDTLIDISKDFGVYWTTLVEENELEPPYNLSPGQMLRIPLPRNK